MKKCLVILSGWAKKNKQGVWKTSGRLGDEFRITAAKYLWDKNKDLFIVASGKKGGLSSVIDKSLAEIIYQELVSLGVDKKIIIKEPGSNNTQEQLARLPGLVKKYKFDNITIISNEWHLPRIKALIEHMVPELKKLFSKKIVKLLAAEKVLVKASPNKWTPRIQKIRSDKAFGLMASKEKRGIQDILNGRYKSTH